MYPPWQDLAHLGPSSTAACPSSCRCRLWVDAVEKRLAIIGVAIGGRFRSIPGRALPPDRRTPEPTCQAYYAIDAHTPSVGGPSRRSAIVLRFCLSAIENARALISMVARSTTCSNQRPDTLMQDRHRQFDEIFLQRTAGPYIRVRMRNTRREQMFSALS